MAVLFLQTSRNTIESKDAIDNKKPNQLTEKNTEYVTTCVTSLSVTTASLDTGQGPGARSTLIFQLFRTFFSEARLLFSLARHSR